MFEDNIELEEFTDFERSLIAKHYIYHSSEWRFYRGQMVLMKRFQIGRNRVWSYGNGIVENNDSAENRKRQLYLRR